MLIRSGLFILRRMLRGYLALILLLVTPMAIISVLGLLTGDAVDPKLGIPIIDELIVTMIITFQLFGGLYTMEYIKNDLLSVTKWRLYALPYRIHQHAFSIILSSSLFSAFQGLILVYLTKWIYGVRWGNIVLVMLVLLLLSVLTQLVYLNLTIGLKNYKAAEGWATAYGLVSVGLAGVWFPMPDSGILNFLTNYGNPLSLGRNAIIASWIGGHGDLILLDILILCAALGVMSVTAIFLGKRKLI